MSCSAANRTDQLNVEHETLKQKWNDLKRALD